MQSKKLISLTITEDGCFSDIMIGDENDNIGAIGISDKLLEYKLIEYLKKYLESATDKKDRAIISLALERYDKSRKSTEALLDLDEEDVKIPTFISWPSQDDINGISQDKMLEVLYNAADCFIPFYELNEEQLDRHDSIRYGLCDCLACKKALTSPGEKKSLGHANLDTYQIGISRDAMKMMMGINNILNLSIGVIPIFILNFIYTILHEVAHIVYLEHNEELTDKHTLHWLKKYDWKQLLVYQSKEVV